MFIPPELHKSAAKPEYPFPDIISGAIYAGVPHYSFISCPGLTILLTPKSPSCKDE
jgi:hypothetical protein